MQNQFDPRTTTGVNTAAIGWRSARRPRCGPPVLHAFSLQLHGFGRAADRHRRPAVRQCRCSSARAVVADRCSAGSIILRAARRSSWR